MRIGMETRGEEWLGWAVGVDLILHRLPLWHYFSKTSQINLHPSIYSVLLQPTPYSTCLLIELEEVFSWGIFPTVCLLDNYRLTS